MSSAIAVAVEPSTTPSNDQKQASISPVTKPPASPKDEIQAVARKVSCEPLQNPDPSAWAVLTAISTNARRRNQGMNILLSGDEHCLGRCVDAHFQIIATSISGSHCKIYKEKVVPADNSSMQVFLKDTSTNGTYHNWVKLKKGSPYARLRHGDIISLVLPPHDDKSYAFVYREIHKSINLANGVVAKRKPEEYGPESKRLKGIGIGAAEGPISLDDVRRLQRSNTELRQQLESHVLTIETLRNENRESIARHENEVKTLKENISNPYLAQIKESLHALDMKQKQLDELNTCSAELRNSIEDLNERLGASMQSRVDADEIIKSQKVTISDLEAQLEEERNQRRGEREKAEVDLKSALQRAHSEAVAEIKRHADDYLKQRREQQEVISKLQESEKESRLLAETLRSKLEDVRENLVLSEKRVRQLEVHVQDEQIASTNNKKKSETLESELKRLRNELESEKVAREEAWAKVSALELKIAAAIRDLSIEKQRFQGAREKLILRETQLRAFYSTTEEISALFKKQQEQLKSMQKTLEDEDNYENASIGPNPNDPAEGNADVAHVTTGEAANTSNRTREASSTLIPKNTKAVDISSDDDDDDISTTEKHDCSMRIHDGDTQDLECTSADRSYKGFDPTIEAVGETVVPDGGPTDTERVLETESPRELGDNNQAGETMQLDIETQAQENLEPAEKPEDNRAGLHSQSRLEDTEPGMIRTVDLLSSEVAGSWAVSTAPSFHGENESPRSMGDDAGALGEDMIAAEATVPCSEGEGQVAGSQNNVTHRATMMSKEHRKLNAMIEIVAPDFRQQFQDGAGSGEEKSGSISGAETEESSGGSDDNNSDANEGMIEDSVG